MSVLPVEEVIDPIGVEVMRNRIDAVCAEAGWTVEKTSLSPIVTESKDYAVVVCDPEGRLVLGYGRVAVHFGASTHAVRSTIAVHGRSIAEGDVFMANDPHGGGGLHPQDVVVQRPVFFDGELVAWVAMSAHMMDMGGMVPGSSASKATECYQEAFRFPPVRVVARGVEVGDIWAVLRTNVRIADQVETDLRSLIAGSYVASEKLKALAAGMGAEAFVRDSRSISRSVERELRRRIADIEDGEYASTGWIEWGEEYYSVPCVLRVGGDRLVFDLAGSPGQVPAYFNSKPYIIQSVAVSELHYLLAPDLPLSQASYDALAFDCPEGSVVNCVPPAPIGAAQLDGALAVRSAAMQCLGLALGASPSARSHAALAAPSLAAVGTARWFYRRPDGSTNVLTIVDGAFGGSPAAVDRDGLDLNMSLVGSANVLEYIDVEILESLYPMVVRERSPRHGSCGAGRHRSGYGLHEVFEATGAESLFGIMTGTRGWFPSYGAAGGRPGATTSFRVRRAGGDLEPVPLQTVGLELRAGDQFLLDCASGGGFGDPLDRGLGVIADDRARGALDDADAAEWYGVVFDPGGTVDADATAACRAGRRATRLRLASAPDRPVDPEVAARTDPDAAVVPLYPGVLQRGRLAFAAESGAPLALAPDDWTSGCAVMVENLPAPEHQDLVARSYLDPASGRALFVEAVPRGDPVSFSVRPSRWTEQDGRGAAGRDGVGAYQALE